MNRLTRTAIISNMSEAQLMMIEGHDQRINEMASVAQRNARLLVSNVIHLRWAGARQAFIAAVNFSASAKKEFTRREQYIQRSGRYRTQA